MLLYLSLTLASTQRPLLAIHRRGSVGDECIGARPDRVAGRQGIVGPWSSGAGAAVYSDCTQAAVRLRHHEVAWTIRGATAAYRRHDLG